MVADLTQLFAYLFEFLHLLELMTKASGDHKASYSIKYELTYENIDKYYTYL